MNSKKISVCLASYNGEKYIREQLDSILPQLGENDEISREITVAIYTNDNINEFDERSKKLILEGK